MQTSEQSATSINHDVNEQNYTVFDWFKKCIKNYVNIEGRAGRKEFWSFLFVFLVVMIISEVILFLFIYSQGSSPSTLISIIIWLFYLTLFCWLLFTILPLICVSIRRLHDINLSGWWALLYFTVIGSLALLIMFCIDTKPVNNKWGFPAKSIN